MISFIRHFPIVGLMLVMAVSDQLAAQPVVRGIDHIPLAVANLERSTADFEALGFTLKPGRPHENGLRNAHVKFPDGTEIELITAPTATDPLSSEYRNWRKGGDGPAFLGIYAPDFGPLAERLSRLGLRLEKKNGVASLAEPATLRQLFFAHRQRSPTDRQQHFDHVNTAFSVAAVWMVGLGAEQRFFQSLGAEPLNEPRCGPLGTSSLVLGMPEGEIVFLPASAQLSPDRSIVGATVTVRSAETARRILTSNRISHTLSTDCESPSVWVSPRVAHGMWLEFREVSH